MMCQNRTIYVGMSMSVTMRISTNIYNLNKVTMNAHDTTYGKME